MFHQLILPYSANENRDLTDEETVIKEERKELHFDARQSEHLQTAAKLNLKDAHVMRSYLVLLFEGEQVLHNKTEAVIVFIQTEIWQIVAARKLPENSQELALIRNSKAWVGYVHGE